MSGPSPANIFGTIKSQLFFRPPLVSSSFEGQTILVTGGNAGLGREAVRQLLQHNAGRVIIACRTISKGETAKKELEAEVGSNTVVEVWELDMASYKSVQAFGERIKSIDRLDAVLENAGMWPAKQATAEGHEETITTNVISTFLLAYYLLPRLQETATKFKTTSRLTFVGSRLHKFGKLKARNDKQHENIFSAVDAQPLKNIADYDGRYQDSKLLLQLYGLRLAKLYRQKHGDGVCISVVNPGYCLSNLKPPTDLQTKVFQRVLARTTEEGGRSYLDSIALDKVHGRHGQFIDDFRVSQSAAWMGTKDGEQTSDRVWGDLNGILDAITPGITASI